MATPQTEKDPKKNNDKPAAAASTAKAGPPAGYKKSATDAVGFFDGDISSEGKAIHCIPIHVVLADSSIEKNKPSALIFVRLIDPCECVRSAEGDGKMDERPLIVTKKDDVVGIWFSAGMRDIATKCGVSTYMYQNGEKPIKGKPSKMKVYEVLSPKEGAQLPVREDRRLHSAGVVAAPFAGKKLAGADTGDAGGKGGDDDIPF